MVERDLTIRVGTTGAAESKAALDSVKQSAESLVTSVSAAQANVESAFAALGEGGLGKGFENVTQFRVAISEADRALVSLRASIAAAKAQGSPIPAGAEEALERYGKAVGVAWQASNSWTYDNRAAAASVEAVTQKVIPAAAAATELAEATGLSAAQLKLLQQGAGLSATQLAALGQQTGFTATETAALTRGAVSLQAALAGEAVSARAAAVAVDAHVVAFRAQQAASASVVTGLQGVRAAFAANSAAIIAGGEGQQAALLGVASAIGKVVMAMEAAKLSGGVVTPAQQAALDAYILKLREVAIAGGLVTAEQVKSTAASSANAGALSQVGVAAGTTTAQKRLLTTATAQAGNAMAGATVSAGGLTAGFLRILGPVGLVGAALALLPTALKAIDSGSATLAKSLVDLINGFHDEDLAVRKSGESLAEYEARVHSAAEAKETMVRASIAMGAGVIEETSNVALATAQWELYRASQLGAAADSVKVTAALKALGIETAKAFTFEEAQSRLSIFITEYERQLLLGENHARNFADANEANIKRWMESYEDAGQAIPETLLVIARSHDVLTEAQTKAAANTKQLADMQKLAEDDARALGLTTQELANLIARYGSVAQQSASQTFNFATGLEVVGDSANGQASALETLIASLQALGLEYDRVKEKGEAAFGGGEGVPSFGTAGTVGAYSSINASGSNLAPGGGGTSTGPTPPPFRYP